MGKPLVDGVVDQLLDRVTAGEFGDDALPREQDLAAQSAVSRLTLREAVRVLAAAGVLRVERGRGTYVNPVSRWRDVRYVARAAGDSDQTSLYLLESRRIIEVGAIELAAQRLGEEEVDAIAACVDAMVEAHAEGDVVRFAVADLDFHTLILEGTGNPFVPVLYRPIESTLRAHRTQMSGFAAVREHAIAHHGAILATLRARDVPAAVEAMAAHITQSLDDLQHYVIEGAD